MSYYDEIRLQEEAKRYKAEVEHQRKQKEIYEAQAKEYLEIIEVLKEAISAMASEINRLKDGR